MSEGRLCTEVILSSPITECMLPLRDGFKATCCDGEMARGVVVGSQNSCWCKRKKIIR